MKKFYQTDEFKKLQDKEYKKLKESGFEDIEDMRLPEPPLKKWHNLVFRKLDLNKIEDATTYFEAARKLLLTYKFESVTHKQIWELHSEGLSYRQIERAINKKGFKKRMIHEYIVHVKRELM